MKTLPVLAASLIAISAHAANVHVSFGEFVAAAAKDTKQMVGADDIKLATDPVTFSLNTENGGTIFTEAETSALFAAIRARAPSRTVTAANGVTLVLDYGRLALKSSDAALPAIFDVQKDIAGYYAENDEDLRGMSSYVNNSYKLRSVTGTIVSYYYSTDHFAAGTPHPDSADGIRAIDVSKVENAYGTVSFVEANLADLVDENTLVAALRADKWLNRKLKASDRRKLHSARNMQELGEVLFNGLANGDTCYSSPVHDGKLSSFAIYDYDAGRNLVAVRVSVGAYNHACSADTPTVHLGLMLKPRLELEYALKQQAKNKNGLLMKNATN